MTCKPNTDKVVLLWGKFHPRSPILFDQSKLVLMSFLSTIQNIHLAQLAKLIFPLSAMQTSAERFWSANYFCFWETERINRKQVASLSIVLMKPHVQQST